MRALLAVALWVTAGGCYARGPDRLVLPLPRAEVAGVVRGESIAKSPSDELFASLAPSGRSLAFVSNESGNLDIWIRDFLSDAVFPLTSDASDESDPSFAPKSEQLLFSGRRLDAKGDIFLISLEGGEPERLTDEATADRQPVFSPDERKIYFTASTPLGLEFIAAMDLEDREVRRLSPSPGFDPAPSPDGRYLIYTAPSAPERPAPHLVALRLADSSTRALTDGQAPAGFARFVDTTTTAQELVLVRFPDDDNDDGVVDGNDQASLWSLRVDLDALFAGAPSAAGPLFPLTAGNRDELFPEVRGGWLYFTETARLDQDIMRLPITGMFPRYDDPAAYLRLASGLLDERERWFALRCLLARTTPDSPLHGRGELEIANIHLEAQRWSLARRALTTLAKNTEDAEPGSARAELFGLAKVELLSLDRRRELNKATTPMAKERVIRAIQAELGDWGARLGWSPKVSARVDLEEAELVLERGDRVEAIAALDRVLLRHGGEPYSAARAMLRRTALLELVHDPDALAEAYGAVLRRFPDQRALVDAAAARMIETQLMAVGPEAVSKIDSLRRLLLRTKSPPVRFAARQRLAAFYKEEGRGELAAAELEQLVLEARKQGADRTAALALEDLARVNEARGELDAALEEWSELQRSFGDQPGVGAIARDAITRVALQRAALAEARGEIAVARDAYRAVLAHDRAQVRAIRRFLNLMAATSKSEEALLELQAERDRSPRAPIARYAYGLALTYREPPELSLALDELDAALRLNPQFAPAYLARGWVEEMLELTAADQGWLEKAVSDYAVAARLNSELTDRETEAEILLNSGNAKWRLADKTNDSGNFGFAYRDYLDRLASGVRFSSPTEEMVFWERLGRAATWEQDWAVSVTAAREALLLAERSGNNERKAQLFGNLAIALGQAGEAEEASKALKSFEAEVSQGKNLSRLVVARRNLAVSRLLAGSAPPDGALDEALLDLSRARQVLASSGVPLGPHEENTRMTVPDATRAPFGFEHDAELDLNLSLAAHAHRRLGEVARASAVERGRVTLLSRIYASHQPLTLSIVREYLGLLLKEAQGACRAARATDCVAGFTRAKELVEDAIQEQALEKALPALFNDRAKVAAIAAEEYALGKAGGEVPPPLRDLDEELRSALADTAKIALTASATSAKGRTTQDLVATSSVALLKLGPVALDAARIHARLLHARGLLALVEADRRARPPKVELPALLTGLDEALLARRDARRAFEDAERVAQIAGSESLYKAAAHGRTQAAPRERKTSLAPSGDVTPSTLDLRQWCIASLAGDPDAPPQVDRALSLLLPSEIGPKDPCVERFLGRTASSALARQDLEAAIDALDRLLLLRVAGQGLAGPVRPEEAADRLFLAELRQASAKIEAAGEETRGPAADRATAARHLAEARQRLAAVRETRASPALRARLLAEPIGADQLASTLGPKDALLFPADIEGRLVVFLVDGSTLAESAMAVHESNDSADAVRARVGRARDLASAGLEVLPEDTRALTAWLLEPFHARLSDKETVILVDAMIDGPLPTRGVFPTSRLAFAHASSPSGFLGAWGAQRVGVEGAVIITSPRSGDLTGIDGDRLTREEALGLRHERVVAPTKETTDRGQRSLAARSRAERLFGRARALLVVEPVLQLEPLAPERGAIQLAPFAGLSPQDRFASELRLGELAISAQTLVLGHVAPHDPGGAVLTKEALLGFDLALAVSGQASTLLIPEAVPRDVVNRALPEIIARLPKLGLARATREVLKDEPKAALVTVFGAPGLDRDGEKAFARAQVPQVRGLVGRLAKEGRLLEVIPALEQLLRLVRAAEIRDQVPAMYTVLVNSLRRAGQKERAADVQRELVELLKEDASEKGVKLRIEAQLELANALSLARDHLAAKEVLEEVIQELRQRGDRLALASAYRRVESVESERLDFPAAAQALERAVEEYRTAGAFNDGKLLPEVLMTLSRLGALYLNRLADPGRARAAYERVLSLVQAKDIRVGVMLDLARVARRQGDFDDAVGRAEAARGEARMIRRPDLELEAVIEWANVAWYRGDYAQGHDLCTESLVLAEANLKAAQKDKVRSRTPDIKRKIYALSVCGVLSMSTRDFPTAERTLMAAVDLARSIQNEAEEAAQYNNLGRVYLEFGRLEQARASFERAKEIDERLNDRFGLAYDLRNLGTALTLAGEEAQAKVALERALELAREVKDENNQLRALSALGELLRKQRAFGPAKERYREVLPLADRVLNKDLAWQAHRALGLIAEQEGDLSSAETELFLAVQVARTLRGRVAASDFGPHRYAAFDDLISLLLRQGRSAEAFDVAELARALAQTDFLDDRRLRFGSKDAPRLIAAVRTTQTATLAEEARRALQRIEPRIAARLFRADPSVLAPRVPEDGAVVAYRHLGEGVAIFVIDRRGLFAQLVPVASSELSRLLDAYRAGFEQRADLAAVQGRLSELLLRPVAERLAGKRRLGLVRDGRLRYVAFPALPFGGGGSLLIDQLQMLIEGLDAQAAVAALAGPPLRPGKGELVAAGIAAQGEARCGGRLDFVDRELDVIKEAHPTARLVRGETATKERLLDALTRGPAVLHFAGHACLKGPDPLVAQLMTAGDSLKLFEVLSVRGAAKLVVLSACQTMIGDPEGTGDELMSLAESFEIAGAKAILASTGRVDDVAAAMVMKRFYRDLDRVGAAEALRSAQQVVRRYEPHPAWWATFTLLVGN